MSDLFNGTLPEQQHPAARITWCGYPAPDGEHPAAGCLRWMGGSVEEPADCRRCDLFISPAPPAQQDTREGGG